MTEAELVRRLRQDGLLQEGGPRLKTFGGGVSSDVWLVEQEGAEPFVVKRSVAKLRVKADWYADPRRLRYEYLYLREAGRIVPGAVPRLLSRGPDAPYMAMEYLGAGYENWKARMLAGDVRVEDARRAGEILGKIHAATRDDAGMAALFDTLPLFRQLRIEPYLLATAEKHPAVAGAIRAEAERLAGCKTALVHGDYSPKNMLAGDGRFVVLDCETAWFGDPVFDLGFCLNHLHLKALHHAPRDAGLRPLVDALRGAYFQAAGADEALDARCARLLLMLLLARADGKSPVEYFGSEKQEVIRAFVLPRLNDWSGSLAELSDQWFAHLGLGA